MPPFNSLFSIEEAQQTIITFAKDKKLQRKNAKGMLHPESEQKPVSGKAQHGAIGDPRYSETCGPEEEVFTISLETPPKDQDLDRSCDWPLLESSYAEDDRNSTFDRSIHIPETVQQAPEAAEEGDPKAEASVTPRQSRSKSSSKDSHIRAPKRCNTRGRAESLTRYVHKYDCEDFMEYSVDIHDWKMSLEEDYAPGEWQQLQYEITPYMRFSLLDWMVMIARTLDFSLETWCLAVNYLDRFLGSQWIGKDCLQLLGVTCLWVAAKQEELVPPSLDQLVALCADTYTPLNFKHMELLVLAKLRFRLAAPTPSYHLSHLLTIQEERDWPEDLARHMTEIILTDHVLARDRPSKLAFAVYEAIKSFDLSAVHILESSCPRCEPHNADMWSQELFQMCLQRVMDIMAT